MRRFILHGCFGMVSASVYYWNGHSSKPAIMDALHQAGVVLSDSQSGPTLIFFTTITQPLLDFIQQIGRAAHGRILAICTAPSVSNHEDSFRLIASGASDLLTWDGAPMCQVAARLERWQKLDQLIASPLVRNTLVGESKVWRAFLSQIIEIACFTESSILMMGETGTGKEEVARLIHALDPQPNKREMVVLDCSTLVPELTGSEFFGHERGAFTGAVAQRDGAFALADGGILFLDEVGELPLGLQAQLLRVLQEHTYKRVGGNTWFKTNFRLIAATHRDLLSEVMAGRFRRDLYYRLASWTCSLPPLRERREDILPLAGAFLRALDPHRTWTQWDESVQSFLTHRDYPGNVRDLKQLIARMFHRHVGPGPLTIGDIPESDRPQYGCGTPDRRDRPFESAIAHALQSNMGLKEIGRLAEEAAINIALTEAGGNLKRAAQKLGVTDRALQLRRAAKKNPVEISEPECPQ